MKKTALTLLLVSALSFGACGRSNDSAAALKALDPDNDGTIDLAEAKPADRKRLPN